MIKRYCCSISTLGIFLNMLKPIQDTTRFLIICYFISNPIYPPTIFFILFYKIQYPNIWYLMWLFYNKSIFNILKDFQISNIMSIIILNPAA